MNNDFTERPMSKERLPICALAGQQLMSNGKTELAELRARLADSFYAKSEPIDLAVTLAALSERNAPEPEEPEEIEPTYDDGLRDNGSFIGV